MFGVVPFICVPDGVRFELVQVTLAREDRIKKRNLIKLGFDSMFSMFLGEIMQIAR